MDNFDEIESSFAEKLGQMSKCPPPEMLLAHRQGALPDDAGSAVERHLKRCKICPILLEDLDSISPKKLSSAEHREIRSRIPELAPKLSAGRWQWYAALVAACAVLAVGIALLMGRQRLVPKGSGRSPESSTAIASLPIEKLAPPQTAGSEIVLRGDVSSAEPTVAELEPAFDAYQKNDYGVAADRFGALAKQFPKSDVPILYLGISQLFLGENEAALQAFIEAEAIAQPGRRDAAAWYHAVAAARSHAPNAVSLLQSVCGNPASAYSQKACSVLSSSGSVQ